jgi:hypothetical protein
MFLNFFIYNSRVVYRRNCYNAIYKVLFYIQTNNYIEEIVITLFIISSIYNLIIIYRKRLAKGMLIGLRKCCF